MDVNDGMQLEAKALADPSRFQLFRHICEADEPVVVADLTELLGFNHNAIRQHLAVLVDAGLVHEANERRTTRGRPRKEYSSRADALRSFGSVSGSYEQLASLLLEVATSEATAYEVGFDRPVEHALPPGSSVDDVIAGLERWFAGEGFEPAVATNGDVQLGHCPFADVASQDPGIVCEIHRGLIDGYLAAQEPPLVGRLEVRNPHTAGCRVRARPAE